MAVATDAAQSTLPKLSAQDHKTYNRLAVMMDAYHNHFRQTWNTLYTTASTGKRSHGMTIRQFISLGENFTRQLTMHHTIEEQHFFPLLADRMPEFRHELSLLTQHKKIHEGIEVLEEYLMACKTGERELRMAEVKEIMDGFGTTLWQHLDDEVKQLGAENMRKFWSLKEMREFPM